MKIKSRKDPPQSVDQINFIAPKKPRKFIEKLREWIKKEDERKQREDQKQTGP